MAVSPLTPLIQLAIDAHTKGDFSVAERHYRSALKLREDPLALKGLGVLLCQKGDLSAGAEALVRSTELAPEDAEAWANLANAWNISKRPFLALEAANKALVIQPGLPGGVLNLASALAGTCRAHESCLVAASAITEDPSNTSLWQMWLLTMLYSPMAGAAEILDAHRLFGSRFPTPARPAKREGLKTIGFIGGDFRHHPVGRFLRQLYEHWPHDRFRLAVFSSGEERDDQTDWFAKTADVFVDVSGMSAAEAADAVRSGEVDLLFDVAGHTACNRLDVMALRPAAVQATWLGYSHTTGMGAIDYFLGDRVTLPEGASQWIAEEPVRMAHSAFKLGRRPVVRERDRGAPFRFGSTNNPVKISPQLIELWCEVMGRAPDAEFEFKFPRFDDMDLCRQFAAEFEKNGVSSKRVWFTGELTREDHAVAFGRIDAVLDTAPYTGATTTIDALELGVPVVTLAGDMYFERMSAAILTDAGLEDLVTRTPEAYVDLAVRLATDELFYEETVQRMGQVVPESPLADQSLLAIDFFAAVDSMWSGSYPKNPAV